jgi:hypothetical protein
MAYQLPDGIVVENWLTFDIYFIGTDANGKVIKDLIAREPGAPASARPSYRSLEGSKYITQTTWAPESGLPTPRQGVFLIVPKAVKAAFSTRIDLVVPADTVKRDDGTIFGCRRFAL